MSQSRVRRMEPIHSVERIELTESSVAVSLSLRHILAYFGVSNSWINMLSVSFMALYLPGYLLSLVVFSRRGLRYGLCLAALLQTAGAWTRVMGTIGASNDHAVHTRGFLIVFIGQCMAAMAQPMFMKSVRGYDKHAAQSSASTSVEHSATLLLQRLSSIECLPDPRSFCHCVIDFSAPARLASEWFGTSQRELATTIGAMSNPVGIAIGQLLPTALVSASGRGMSTLLLVTAGASTATMLFCFLCVRSEPVTAPSRSMEERRAARADAASASALSRAAVPFGQSPLVLELKSLASNRQFWVLMFGVGMGLGLFNAVTTLIGQLVRPAGYTKDDAGNFGALLIGCGLVGAAVVGPIMDKTKAFNALLKAGLIAAMSGTCFMLLSLRPGHSAQVCASFGVLGFVMLPLLPVCMACAAECTYPVSEDASSGAMLFAGNIVGIIMISVVGEIIQTKYSTVWNPARSIDTSGAQQWTQRWLPLLLFSSLML